MSRLARADVEAAASVLAELSNETPVMTSRTLDYRLGLQVFLKCEQFQRTGSFKFRGAMNFMAGLSVEQLARGVCTVSAGNHAQAVALAARLSGTRASILMPDDAPAVKLAAVADYGASITTYERTSMPQATAGEAFASETDQTFVPAYDDRRVAAGAGTLALELFDQVGGLDAVLVPVGGGGALAGIATIAKALHPSCRVIGVDPAAAPVARLSLEQGERVHLEPAGHLADGQMLSSLGALPFRVLTELVDEVRSVADPEILMAMAFLFDRLKLVTEPSGATAFAALLSGPPLPRNSRVGVVLTGGNVGLQRFTSLLGQAPTTKGSDSAGQRASRPARPGGLRDPA